MQITSKRLCSREKYSAIRHSVPLDVIELPIRMILIVIIQSVTVEHLQQSLILNSHFRDVRQINSRCIALIFDIKFKLLLFNIRSQTIDVLHHKVPVSLRRIIAGIFNSLYKYSFVRTGIVSCEFSHLISDTSVCIFESHSQHLICL